MMGLKAWSASSSPASPYDSLSSPSYPASSSGSSPPCYEESRLRISDFNIRESNVGIPAALYFSLD